MKWTRYIQPNHFDAYNTELGVVKNEWEMGKSLTRLTEKEKKTKSKAFCQAQKIQAVRLH